MKPIYYIIIPLSLTLALSSCSRNTPAKDTLIVDINAEPGSLDPQRAEIASDFRVTNDLFSGLIDYDQTNRPIPGMAESYTISPDGKTYTFHLRNGLKFSDGTPITANDFVYSWRRLVDPQTASAYNFILSGVVNAEDIIDGRKIPATLGVSAADKQTFVVTLSHPMNEFLTYITAPGVDVVPRHIIQKYGKAWTDPKYIVTSGAYTLKEHVVNGYILNEKNPQYYAKDSVHIDKVKYLPLVDTNVSIATYETGGLDTTWKNVPIDKFAAIRAKYASQLHVTPAERTVHLSFNLRLPRYANDIKLREALSIAVDRDALVNQVLKSGQKSLYSIVTPTIEHGKYADVKYAWSAYPRIEQIALAKKLYKEAGYGADKPLTITISTYTNDMNKKVCLAIASMWHDVLGADVKLDIKDMKSWLFSGRRGDFDVRLSTWGADYNFVTTYTTIYQCENGNNFSAYCSPAYEAQLQSAAQTLDTNGQTAKYKEAITTVLNDYPVIPLFQPSQQRLVNPRVLNYQIEENYLDNVQSKWFSLR